MVHQSAARAIMYAFPKQGILRPGRGSCTIVRQALSSKGRVLCWSVRFQLVWRPNQGDGLWKICGRWAYAGDANPMFVVTAEFVERPLHLFKHNTTQLMADLMQCNEEA